jgi:endonuclease/exonuclease/phosphatase (EEP) superfamily protein YafD
MILAGLVVAVVIAVVFVVTLPWTLVAFIRRRTRGTKNG